jgi:hypothetical protein
MSMDLRGSDLTRFIVRGIKGLGLYKFTYKGFMLPSRKFLNDGVKTLLCGGKI